LATKETSMGEVLRIDLNVEPVIAAEIDAAIASGQYRNVGDLVSEALADWHASRHPDVERLRRLWEEGLASGEPQDVTPEWFDDVYERSMAKLAEHRAAK